MQFDPVTTRHPVYWLKQHLRWLNRSCSVLKGYDRYNPTLFTNLSIVNWGYIALFISSPIQMFGQSQVSYPQYTKMKSSRSQYWRGRVSEDLCRDGVATRSVQGCPLAYNIDPCARYTTAYIVPISKWTVHNVSKRTISMLFLFFRYFLKNKTISALSLYDTSSNQWMNKMLSQ